MNARDILGTWTLVRFSVRASDGRPERFPFGEDACGQVVYAADGHMSAFLARAPTASAAQLETSHRLPVEVKAQAFDATLAYAGRWALDGDEVHHDVSLALVPGLVGQRLTRRVSWLGSHLVLSYSLVDRQGVTHGFSLEWRRPEPRGGVV